MKVLIKYHLKGYRHIQEIRMNSTKYEPKTQEQNHDIETFIVGCDELPIAETFDDMNLSEDLLRGIYGYGFEQPTLIQKQAILLGITKGKKRDIIAQSQSGTGKTATFIITTFQNIDLSLQKVQAIILSPTRRLSEQIFKVATALGRFIKNLKLALCVGGESLSENIRQLDSGAQVVIGCPGRVYDLLTRNRLLTKDIKMFCLDEADQMLTHKFVYQIQDIFERLPQNVQKLLFSATIPPVMFNITRKFMDKPIRLLLKTNEITLEGIKQFFVNVEREQYKLGALVDIYENITASQCIIYCNSVDRVERLCDYLDSQKFSVTKCHGKMDNDRQIWVLKQFSAGNYRILVSSDLTARGIDIQQISLVINYDIPFKNIETYVHRIGRSGRFGRVGAAISIITNRDIRCMEQIERTFKTKIEPLPENYSKII